MRTIAFAILLFAAGFGIVSIGQQAIAFFGHNRIAERLDDAMLTGSIGEPAERAQAARTYADYVAATERAFMAMDRTCSSAARRALGEAFDDLLSATKALHAGRIEAGALDRSTTARITGAGTDMVLASAASSGDLQIFAKVIDASRRGVLTAGDFPLGMAKLMHIQMKMNRDNRSELAAGLASAGTTRCLPM
jgi:hypothetical protein